MATNKKIGKKRTTVAKKVFKYWKETSPFFVNELFVSSRNKCKTKLNMASEIPLRKSKLSQKNILIF